MSEQANNEGVLYELATDDASWEGMAGDLVIVPQDRHSVEAVEDSAFVLTVAKTL